VKNKKLVIAEMTRRNDEEAKAAVANFSFALFFILPSE